VGVSRDALIAPLDGTDVLVRGPAARAALRQRVDHLIVADPAG
jgi:hypothetical protein